MNMLLRHLWPREDEYRRRARLVSQAARWLRISEYALFRRAYERWHGTAPGDRQLERIFVRFLYSGDLPGWAEDYAQQIVEQAWREDPSTIPMHKRVFALPNVVVRCVAVSWWLRHHPRSPRDLYA